MKSQYFSHYDGWRKDAEEFWTRAAEEIDWFEPAKRVFAPEMGIYGRWFEGAQCNSCFNCLDRHVKAGRANQPALIYDSPLTGTHAQITYGELLERVSAFGAVLQDFGIGKGDCVLIYMPMVPDTIVAMLACARIGAIHSVVFGGFAAREVATRIDDSRPKLIIAASCGIEPGRIVPYHPIVGEAVDMAKNKPEACLILQRAQSPAELLPGRDHDFAGLLDTALSQGRRSECARLAATDPLYVLYTSGTTGKPKGVVRDNGGHLVSLKWSMSNFYGAQPGDVFWAASDVGWVVGHSYIVYAPLLHGCTSIIYEGKPVGTPDAGAFWRVISENNVNVLFTAPTTLRAIKREDPKGDHIRSYDLSKFRTLFLAGEKLDSDTLGWAERQLNIPVIDHWWQTETGWPISGNPVGLGILPVKPGSAGFAMPGYDIRILDDAGEELPAGTLGNVVIKLPLPPGCLPTLWEDDARFRQSYLNRFAGYYQSADAGYIDEDGYLFVMSRTDDIINVAGHRLSTGAMEEVLASHEHIAECAVVGIRDSLKGQIPCGIAVLNSGAEREHSMIEAELIQLMREKIGPVAAFKHVAIVKRLPKTRSGKVLRGTISKIADAQPYDLPPTIEDPAVLDEITIALRRIGLAGPAN